MNKIQLLQQEVHKVAPVDAFERFPVQFDTFNRGYVIWDDYLRDESENGYLITCSECHATVFIWLDCRRGTLDKYCAVCGHSHRSQIIQEYREGVFTC